MSDQVTPHLAYETLGRVHELLMQALDLTLELAVSPIRVGELRSAIGASRRIAQEHQKAAEILLNQPLADHYPDGTPRQSCLSPRQVAYLAALAMPDPVQSRELIGLPPSRQCLRERADGHKCGSSSLLFTLEATCHGHATPAERERNRKEKDRWNQLHPDYRI